jgi:1-acyl-sn-glycerol-3-phosphate acyltransferase
MFAIILLLINLATIFFGIYLFDYLPDGSVNTVWIILLSIIAGTVVMVIVFALYVDIFYVLVAKRKPKNSMLKHFIAKQIMTVPLVATNTRIEVVGKENLPKDPGFSIYSNHTSMMDIPVLMYKLKEYPIAFLAKQVVGRLVSVGKWTPQLGCVMIDRENTRKGAEAIINVIKNVKSGITMVVFPEGTRSKETGKLLDFKPGSFKVALKSKAPLVPVSIVKESNFKNIKWPLKKKIKLVIHEALPYDKVKTMTSIELSNHVKNIIESSLNT